MKYQAVQPGITVHIFSFCDSFLRKPMSTVYCLWLVLVVGDPLVILQVLKQF